MNSFKGKATFYITAAMIIVCSIAVFIATKVTIIAVGRQEQEVRNIPPTVTVSAEASTKNINTNKLNEHTLFFNGKKVDDISVFYSDKKQVMLPIDQIFSRIGLKFRFYASDDMFETELDGKKLTIRMGKDSLSYGDAEITLPYASVAAKEHILVPAEAFEYLNGFSVNSLISQNTTFLNYYGGSRPFENQMVGLLRLHDGIGSILNFSGDKILWDRKNAYGTDEYFEASPDGSMYLLKSGKMVYLVNPKQSPEPYLIDVNFWCEWSKDSKYLYWEETLGGTPYIYDIEQNVKHKLEDNLWRAESLDGYEGFSKGIRELMEYVEYGSYKRITLKNTAINKVYTIIQKNGRILAEGDIQLSPDKNKMVFKGTDRIYMLANQDGTDMVSLGESLNVTWITNNKIMLDKANEKYLYDVIGGNKAVVNSVWKMLGQATDGAIFYTDGAVIYAESGGVEIELMRYTWDCNYIVASSIKGPFIILSQKENKIFYANEGTVTTIGKYSSMLRDKSASKDNFDVPKSVIVSPSKDRLLVIQKEEGLLTLHFLGSNLDSEEKIVLDYTTMDIPIVDNIEINWVSQNNILLYTNKNVWLVNLDSGTQIQRLSEKDGAIIEGVLLPK